SVHSAHSRSRSVHVLSEAVHVLRVRVCAPFPFAKRIRTRTQRSGTRTRTRSAPRRDEAGPCRVRVRVRVRGGGARTSRGGRRSTIQACRRWPIGLDELSTFGLICRDLIETAITNSPAARERTPAGGLSARHHQPRHTRVPAPRGCPPRAARGTACGLR